jgi:hypothetical protein
MNTDQRRKVEEFAPVVVRFSPERKLMLQLIADTETEGNLSELVRRTMDEKIASRLTRGRSTPTDAAA